MFYKVLVSPEEGFRWAPYSNHRGQKNSFTLNYTEKTLSFPVGREINVSYCVITLACERRRISFLSAFLSVIVIN